MLKHGQEEVFANRNTQNECIVSSFACFLRCAQFEKTMQFSSERNGVVRGTGGWLFQSSKKTTVAIFRF